MMCDDLSKCSIGRRRLRLLSDSQRHDCRHPSGKTAGWHSGDSVFADLYGSQKLITILCPGAIIRFPWMFSVHVSSMV